MRIRWATLDNAGVTYLHYGFRYLWDIDQLTEISHITTLIDLR